MADWYGVVLRRLLRSAERFSDRAIRCGLLDLNTDFSRSSALLCLVTRADQRPDRAVPLRAGALRAVVFLRAVLRVLAMAQPHLRPFCGAWTLVRPARRGAM